MKKRTGKLALALAALAMLVTTFGCKDPNNGIKTVEEETKSYTVTFNTNGGSAIEAVSVDEGNTLTLPDDPTKTGYDFKGWFTDDALSAEFDATVAITEDTTLYAKWSVIEYTITYVLNDENATNAATNPAKYTIESEAITLAEPTTTNTEKPNFSGWYSDETLATVATGIAKGSTGNKTFYASWSATKQYTVTFYNGETSLGTVKVTEGEKVTIPSTIAVEGYTIEGWYTDSDLTKAFDANSAISANTALYANVKALILITFDANEGAVTTSKQYVEENVSTKLKTVSELSLVRTGYTFKGWNTEADGSGTTYADGANITISSSITLYAQWKKNLVTYTVTFDTDGGSTGFAIVVAENTAVSKPEDPTKDDYIFAGWYLEGSESEYDFSTLIIKDITLKAKWTTEPVYTLTINFGDISTDMTITTTKDDSYTVTEPTYSYPRKFTVSKYYSDADKTDEITFPIILSSDKTIYAETVATYKVLVAADEKTYTTGSDYGSQAGNQFMIWSNNEGVSVSVGDWLIISGTIAFENMGQVYAQAGIGSNYPNLKQFYTTTTGTNSYEYYCVYRIVNEGNLTMIAFNNGSATGSGVTNLTAGSTVTITDLKVVHIPVNQLTTVLPFYSFTESMEVEGATLNNKDNSYQIAPEINAVMPKFSSLTASFTRPAITNDYQSHYMNSALTWTATYPDKSGQTVTIAKTASEETEINWMQVGIQAGADEGTMEWTNVEISIIPNIAAF